MRIHQTFMMLSILLFSLMLTACGGGGGGDSGEDTTPPTDPGTATTAPNDPGAATVAPRDTKLALSWTAVSGATNYEVWYHTADNSAAAIQSGGAIAGTTHTITGLTNGTSYFVWLKAKNSVGTSGFGPSATGSPAMWTWIAGDDTGNQTGVYGEKGVAATANKPGSRNSSVSWKDSNGNFWLFGGQGYDSVGVRDLLSDLWKFDGTNWTWISGDKTVNNSGVYGTKGDASSDNKPGGRAYSISWIDSSGDLWLFGGLGYASSGPAGELNDLWRFDGADWTWVSGSDTTGQNGVYGTKGDASSDNIPGARTYSVSWTDSSDNLWLFGGNNSVIGYFNDLWKFDGTYWTWVSGDNAVNQYGVYGVKGDASSDNKPGARIYGTSWTDSSGDFWLFGGHGYDSDGTTAENINDLWRFDGANWTWISGDEFTQQAGVYGTKGDASSDNKPGARSYVVSWVDSSGNFWLFGGGGYDSTGTYGWLNDLWKYDGSNWTWMSGDSTSDNDGVYGTKGTAADANKPGSRHSGVGWIDGNDNLWLFGGQGHDSNGDSVDLNDLWKAAP